ncbi:hypothetical protein KC974_01900 [Candidatus Saccharibacteria bacterium]|jgi:hypothetical protein|nr:hypothetical protein [Candidatus Saccharibacteria bacterium]
MSRNKNPEIRINYSGLLTSDVSAKIAELKKWDLKSDEQYEKWTEAFCQSWNKHGDAILAEMQIITGLEFYLPVIDITVSPCIIPKSQPLIIGFKDTPETVIETITHELSHTLLCDNKIISIYGKDRDFMLGNEWRKLFGFEDDFTALVHIPVHAICQKVFQDSLGDKTYVKRDRKLMEDLGATSYLKSWDYVEQEGADLIIEKLKKSYLEIAKRLEKQK